MKFRFATAMRRARRLSRARRASSAKALQRAIGTAMARTVRASLPPLAAMAPGKPNAAKKRRKAPVKVPRRRTSSVRRPTDGRLGAVLKLLRTATASAPGTFMLSGMATSSKPPAIPKGAQYLARTHRCAAGARDFKLYIPARQPRGPKGLIVMLHGCAQDPDDFATGTNMNRVAQRHGLAVAYPEQTRAHNASCCWNWFGPANQSRGRGEPAILASLARGLMREFDLDRNSMFVAGLSAGGAMAVILADTYPDVFSAAGTHSGVPRGAAGNVVSALSAMRSGARRAASAGSRSKSAPGAGRHVRRIVFHGDADRTVHPSNAPRIVAGAVGTRKPARVTPSSASGRDYVRSDYILPDGSVDVELWQVKETGHAWSGGKSGGTYTDTRGPNASEEMVRFFTDRNS